MKHIKDPRRYVYVGMGEMGLANFFQACAEACALSASKCGPSTYEQNSADRWRNFEKECLLLMTRANGLDMHHPFVTDEGA